MVLKLLEPGGSEGPEPGGFRRLNPVPLEGSEPIERIIREPGRPSRFELNWLEN